MVDLDPRGMGGVRELVVYAALVLAAWLVALVLRSLLRGGGGRVAVHEPEHVAYLTGGPVQAVYAAVAALRGTGGVRAADGRIHAGGPLVRDAGELAAAVHLAARAGMPVGVLRAHPAVRAALDRIDALLVGQGVLLSRGRRRAMGLVAVPLFALTLFGAARLAWNLPTEERPELDEFLVILFTMLCAVAALIAAIVVAARPPVRTREADRLIRELRRRYAALAPRYNPSLTGNGPAAATLAVGLFGTAALWAADPAFASAAEVPEQRVTAAGGYGGDRGYEVSDGSGCGSP